MSTKNEVSREELLRAATLVRPAISNQSYIPSLSHIKFEGGWLTSSNDVSAIAVKGPDAELSRCLPGELLIKALSSLNGDKALVQENHKEGTVVLSSGRSKLKLHTLPVGDFPFEWPEGNYPSVNLDDSVLRGIERCLISVGSDPTHASQMGVTLDSDKQGKAVLFSTDNFTISRCSTTSKISLPGDSPIILPTFFCEQLVLLSKTFADSEVSISLLPGALMAVFGNEAQLFTKSPMDLEPIDFERMISRYFKVEDVVRIQRPAPDGFESALNRAMLVLSKVVDRSTKVNLGEGVLRLFTTSDLGDANESLSFDGDDFELFESEKPFQVDPALVLRASKSCTQLAPLPKVLLMSNDDASFIHMISHCAS